MRFSAAVFPVVIALVCAVCLLTGCDDDSDDDGPADDDLNDDINDDTASPGDDDLDDDTASPDDDVDDDADDDVEDLPTIPICDLNAGNVRVPFPSMYFTQVDESRSTGIHLTMDKELPEAVGAALDAAAGTDFDVAIPELDGFSILSSIMIPFSGPLDAPAWVEGSPGILMQPLEGFVRLADVTGDVPRLLEYKISMIEGRNVLVINPATPLSPARRILVCVAGPLNDASGRAVERNPLFDSVLNDEPGLPDDPLVDDMKEARDIILLGPLGVALDDTLLAFTYRTGTGQKMIHAMRAIVEELDATTPIEPQDLTWDGDRTLRGTYPSPDFRVDGYLPTENPDELEIALTADLDFVLRLPENIDEALYPLIYLHGLGGSRNWSPSVEGAAVFAIDAVLHGGRDEDFESDAPYPFLDFKKVRLLRDNIRQTASDHVALARMIRHIADDPDGYGLPPITGGALATLGHSLGCINGMAFSSIDPAVDHAVGVGGGGMFSLFQRESVYGFFMPAAIRGLPPYESLIFRHLMQAALDPADPAALSPGLIREPPDGRSPRNVIIVDVIGDRSVPNIASEALAWAAGVGTFEGAPSNNFGLDEFALPLTGNFNDATGLIYEFVMNNVGVTERHGELFESDAQWNLVKTFLQTGVDNGVATAVDPEVSQ